MEVNMSARAGVGSVIVIAILGVMVVHSIWGMVMSLFYHHDHFLDSLIWAVVFGILFLWMRRRYLRISEKE
jgi:hypothetical protein